MYWHGEGACVLQCFEIHLNWVSWVVLHVQFLVMYEYFFLSFFVITEVFLQVLDYLLRCFPTSCPSLLYSSRKTGSGIYTWSFTPLHFSACSFLCFSSVCCHRRNEWRILILWTYLVSWWWRRWWCHFWLAIPCQCRWERLVYIKRLRNQRPTHIVPPNVSTSVKLIWICIVLLLEPFWRKYALGWVWGFLYIYL